MSQASSWLNVGSALAGVVLGTSLGVFGNAWLERRRFQREEARRVLIMTEDAARALLGWCLDAAEQAVRPYRYGWPPPTGLSEEQHAENAEARKRLRELTRLIDIRLHDLVDAKVRIAVEQYSSILHHPQQVLEWSSRDVTANTPNEVVWDAKETIVGILGAVIRHQPIPPANPLPQMKAGIEEFYQAEEAFWRSQGTKTPDTGAEGEQPNDPD
jgi:hypothetical protein